MVQWDDYRVIVHLYRSVPKLTIRHGRTKTKYSLAGDRTDEILSAVLEYFRMKFERQKDKSKNYIGVSSNYGKLLYIPKGFSIRQNQDGSIKIDPPKPPERRTIDYGK